MKNSNIIHWGILGCGKIARKFADDLQKINNARIQAVASRSLDKAKDFALQYNTENYYDNYSELAKDSSIDVVYIATPHVFHKDHALLCLENKKAVLCEKPLAMNRREVQEMINCAKANDVFLMEALWTYFLPHYIYVLDIVRSKKLGSVLSLDADFGFEATYDPLGRLFNKKLGGGSLLDVGIYPIFAALTILGHPADLNAHAIIGNTGVDESCTMEFLYNNGAIARLSSSIKESTTTKAIIQFEKGKITINSRFHEPTDLVITTNNIDKIKTFNYNAVNGYLYEAIHVQQMLQTHQRESSIMDFSTSLALIELLDIVRKKIGLNYT